jgi:hypothetical protein
LEQVCGGSSVFPSHSKTETMLMNLLMPLCIRVGSGRKGKFSVAPSHISRCGRLADMPRMRQADISFALTIVLHALNPPATKTSPVTAQNIKSVSEMRTASLTLGSRDSKRQTPIPLSLYKVAFLGEPNATRPESNSWSSCSLENDDRVLRERTRDGLAAHRQDCPGTRTQGRSERIPLDFLGLCRDAAASALRPAPPLRQHHGKSVLFHS